MVEYTRQGSSLRAVCIESCQNQDGQTVGSQTASFLKLLECLLARLFDPAPCRWARPLRGKPRRESKLCPFIAAIFGSWLKNVPGADCDGHADVTLHRQPQLISMMFRGSLLGSHVSSGSCRPSQVHLNIGGGGCTNRGPQIRPHCIMILTFQDIYTGPPFFEIPMWEKGALLAFHLQVPVKGSRTDMQHEAPKRAHPVTPFLYRRRSHGQNSLQGDYIGIR